MKRIVVLRLLICLLAGGCMGTKQGDTEKPEGESTAFSAKVSYRSSVPKSGDELGTLQNSTLLEIEGDRSAIVEAIVEIVANADIGQPDRAVQIEWSVGSDLYEILVQGGGQNTMYTGRFRIYTRNGTLHISTGIGRLSKSKQQFLDGLKLHLLDEESYLTF